MGIWKEIKYALNSTLGTEKFKPLDNLILNNRMFVANSDFVVKNFNVNNGAIHDDVETFAQFKSEIGGTLYLYMDCRVIGSGEKYVYLTSENNETQTFTIPYTAGQNTYTNNWLINIRPDTKYTLQAQTTLSSASITINSASLRGIATLGNQIEQL